MGAKLIFILTFLCCLSACSGLQKFKKSDYYVSEENFIKSYQSAFICGCINGLTNDSLNRFITEINDNGLFTDIEIISYAKVNEADSLGRAFSERIKIINYEDAGYKKPVVSGCIKLGLSEELLSIAKKKYKELMKQSKK